MNNEILPSDYKETLELIIQKIESAQQKAVISANKTLLDLYWDIGNVILNKKKEQTYIKEFDRIKKEYDLKGHIRSNSIILCEMMITSDNEFFEKIGLEETKRYFRESYEFVCNYKNLGEKYIVSAVVHLDETTPHMHLIYIPVIHTKDKEGNLIDKICARDFWRGRDSYRDLQNEFHKYITSKNRRIKKK